MVQGPFLLRYDLAPAPKNRAKGKILHPCPGRAPKSTGARNTASALRTFYGQEVPASGVSNKEKGEGFRD
jgi:hypothetical protein